MRIASETEGKERRNARSHIRKRLKLKLLKKLKDHHCPYCGYKMYDQPTKTKKVHKRAITVDHLYPESHGGLYNDLDNTILCCRKCNKKKKEQLPLNFIWNNSNKYLDKSGSQV
jgi:5-methylcytosine-specific restriction endonuclease McrA